MFCKLIVLLAILATVFASVHLPERARGGIAHGEHKLRLSANPATPLTWSAPIDHFNNSTESTFKQRYFVDDSYFKGGDSPVFFEIGGEGTLGGPPGGFIADLAKEHGALLVALEHRFYGESIPNGNSKTENLKYLTVEQALADLNAFTNYYTKQKNLHGKWFVFGGSYPGALSSWYRNQYPDASVGSLSSSGVVNPIVDYYQFDEAVSAAIGNECGSRLKKISKAFEKSIENDFPAALKQMHCEEDMAEVDYLYMLADSWSMADQYGKKSALCSAIMAAPEDADIHTLTQTFADFSLSYWGEGFCSAGFYNTKALADPARWDTNSRSWRWQTCYQVAWFNTAPAQGSIRSQRVNLDYHLKQCEHIFGYKMSPATQPLIKKYGGDMPHPVHNVFYSDFSDDPWRTASVQYPPAIDQPYHLAMCDDCGHCADFHAPANSDPPQLTQGRKEFAKYVKKWLS
jgi:pimeloyl-ACP methyl ester carboxylesterase